MSPTRRDFLQSSATAAAALTIAPAVRTAEGFVPLEVPREVPKVSGVENALRRARPLDLTRVRITGGPLKVAQDADARYLLSLEPDRMLAYYRTRAGLEPKAKPYGGWDGGGRNLTGHIAGHHLSAVSLMYASTGDAAFKQRADYIVSELAAVQQKNGDGYLCALEGGREAFARLTKGEIKSAAFDLNGLWSPWYTLHKTFAGLRDAYRHTGNRTALGVSTHFAGWAEGVVAPLTDDQMQHMLNTEHGGMNEVLADLYADTGDTRWLALSRRFEHQAFITPLKRGEDNLSGKHVNCQIPKLMGSAARYGYAGDPADIIAASFFWDRVAHHHSYATGGMGHDEYFGPPDGEGAQVDGRDCESCNVYNMLKLSRRLFSFRPDGQYADYMERELFNHAQASFDPNTGQMSYMVPVGRAVQQEYQNMLESFTCCVGTGMETHAMYGDGLYFESDDTLWVNQFVPSQARFTTGGTSLRMDTDFPVGDRATITVTASSNRKLTMAVRRPVWAGDGFTIAVNGTALPQPPIASLDNFAAGGRANAPGNEAAAHSSYVEITQVWKPGDVVEVGLPKALHLAATPDKPNVAAIMWGPLVLAGDLGPRRHRADPDDPEQKDQSPATPPLRAPVLVGRDRPVDQWVVADGATPGNFVARGVARGAGSTGAGDVALTPFYRTHQRTYSVYFDML
jgi:DUF1680 family protein